MQRDTSILESLTIMDWKKDQEECLNTCREAVETNQLHHALSSIQALCRHYANHRLITEWELFFREVHTIFESYLEFKPNHQAVPESKIKSMHQLQNIWAETLPSITPFQLKIIHFENLTTFEEKVKELPNKVHHLLYWCDTDNIHLRYLNPKGQFFNSDEKNLLASIKETSRSKKLVDDLLALITLQDQLKSHPRLTFELMRNLFIILIEKKYLTEEVKTEKQRRIIYQKNNRENIYYAELFPSIDLEQIDSLPGQWIVVFPSRLSNPVIINQCSGWMQLDRVLHTELVCLLDQQEKQYQQEQRYQFSCFFYQAFSNHLLIEKLPDTVISSWYSTTAEMSAQYERWRPLFDYNLLQPPYAILAGSVALEYMDSNSKTCKDFQIALDTWITKALSKIIYPLLPLTQEHFAQALRPWQKKTGELNIDDFENTLFILQNMVQRFLWIAPDFIQQVYSDFNQACLEKKNDILTQIRKLEFEKMPILGQQKTKQRWQQAWQTLLSQWQKNGYHYEITIWTPALRAALSPPEKKSSFEEKLVQNLHMPWLEIQSPENSKLSLFQSGLESLRVALSLPENENSFEEKLVKKPHIPWLEIKSPENSALSLFQSGLESLILQIDSKSKENVLKQWRQAHIDWQNILREYAMHGQKFVFHKAKSRYRARLSSYQLLCEGLSSIHTEFSLAVDWCQNRVAETNLISLSTLTRIPIIPSQWQWQTIRNQLNTSEVTSQKTLLFVFEKLIIHIQSLLGEMPSSFEMIGMVSNTSPAYWRFHLLLNQSNQQVYFSVFLSLFQLYHSLLPLNVAPLNSQKFKNDIPAISCDTPDQLAGKYCPLFLDTTETKLLEKENVTYLAVFHYQSQDSETNHLFSHFISHLIRRLQQINSQGKEQEKRIRKHYHALSTQTLVETKERAIELKNLTLTDPIVMLKQRRKAHQEIQQLWDYLRERYNPLIDMLVHLAVTNPKIIKACLQDLGAEIPEEKKKELSDFSHLLRFYRYLSRIWKPRYFQQLNAFWETPSSHQLHCLQLIRNDPDETGWRYRQLEEDENWKHSLHTLFISEEKISREHSTAKEIKKITLPVLKISYIENGKLQQGQLRREVAEQLLDPKNPYQWRQKAKKTGGRHHVLRVESSDKLAFWFKFDPEQAGTEELVKKIHERTGVFGTAAQQFMKITIDEKPGMPVLISQEVSPPASHPKVDNNLAQILLSRPELLKQLSPLSFVSNLVIVLILNPEDDKSNSYFLLPDTDGQFTLKHIDNDRAFFRATQEGWFKELNVKTIIFCMDQMTVSWKELEKKDSRLQEYRQNLQRIVPSECLQDLLKETSDLHDHWCWLFSEEEAVAIAQGALRKGEISFPLMMVLPDCETALLERFYLLQKALNDPDLNGLNLLERIQPGLSDFYRILFKSGTTPNSRFEAGPGKLYTHHNGQLHTTMSGLVSLSRQLNLDAIVKLGNDTRQETLIKELVQQIWRRQAYSATQAIYKIGLRLEENKLGIEQGLLGTSMNQMENTYQTAQLQFQRLPFSDRTNMLPELGKALSTIHTDLQSRRQAAIRILRALTQAPVGCLLLAPFHEALTDDILIQILKCSSRQLYLLDISGCVLLTIKIISVIEIHCKNLHTLRARGLNWTEITISNLSQLKRLNLSYSSRLNRVILQELNRLKTLRVNNCDLLHSLGDKQFGFWKTQLVSINLPNLEKLNISQCKSLVEIRITAEQLDFKKSSFEGCNTKGLLNWLDLLLSKEDLNNPFGFFKQIDSILSEEQKTLDISHIKFNKKEFEWLCRIIQCNLSFTQLIYRPKKNNYSDNYSFNILLLGADGVGKSALLGRIRGYYSGITISTTGVDFTIKKLDVDGHSCTLRIWDSPGQERYRETIYGHIRMMNLVIICFNLNKYETSSEVGYYPYGFEDVKLWINLIPKYANKDLPKIIVRTKCDDNKKVDLDKQYKEYADTNNISYFKCSAETGKGVEEILLSACTTLIGLKDEIVTHKLAPNFFPYEIKPLIEALQHNKVLTSVEANFLNKEDKLIVDKLIKEKNELKATKKDEELKKITMTTQENIIPFFSELPVDVTTNDEKKSQPLITHENLLAPEKEEKKVDLTIQQKPEEVIHLENDSDSLTTLIMPFTEIKNFDAKSLQQAANQLPALISRSLGPLQEQLYHLKNRLPDETVAEDILELLKYLCLSCQYQQKALISSEDSLEMSYIRSKPALIQYHDLLLQTLEFSIKAAILGVTGSFKTTDTMDSCINGIGDILGAIPGIGGAVKIPIAALAFSNQLKIKRQHYQVSQLFSGGRDVESKVEELALKMTLAIREELLNNKITKNRREAIEKNTIENYYSRAKNLFKQQKIQWLNWQLLTPAQKLALWDADYLLNQLPNLGNASKYRQKDHWISICLGLLMRQPDFTFSSDLLDIKASTISSPYEETATRNRRKKYLHYSTQREISLKNLQKSMQQLESIHHWKTLLPLVAELEVALWELNLLEEEIEKSEKTLVTLTNWFEQLKPKNSSLIATPSISEVLEDGLSIFSPPKENLLSRPINKSNTFTLEYNS